MHVEFFFYIPSLYMYLFSGFCFISLPTLKIIAKKIIYIEIEQMFDRIEN